MRLRRCCFVQKTNPADRMDIGVRDLVHFVSLFSKQFGEKNGNQSCLTYQRNSLKNVAIWDL